MYRDPRFESWMRAVPLFWTPACPSSDFYPSDDEEAKMMMMMMMMMYLLPMSLSPFSFFIPKSFHACCPPAAHAPHLPPDSSGLLVGGGCEGLYGAGCGKGPLLGYFW
jgi:hypothetical protein